MSHQPPAHHQHDTGAVEREVELGQDYWQMMRDRGVTRGSELVIKRGFATKLLGGGLVGRPELVSTALSTVARTTAAHLTMVRAPGRAFTIEIDGKQETLDGPSSTDFFGQSDWLDGFHAALAVRDDEAAALLLAVPEDLWSSNPEAPIWAEVVRFLCDLHLGVLPDPDPAATATALANRALDGLAPDVRGIAEADLAPLLRAWSVGLGGGDLGSVLVTGLQAHARFWPNVEDVDRPKGYVAIWLLGAAAWAWDIGIRVPLHTPYLPRAILTRAPRSTVICCAYCITPIHERAPQCAACLEPTGRDASLELDRHELRVRLARCKHCGFPLHRLAVRCGRCMKSQSA